METNISDVISNVTLHKVIYLLHQNISAVNESELTQKQLIATNVIYIVGSLIILSNITVVISSGLILKNGHKPKSTYQLLGNLSLADTVVGFCLIFNVTVNNTTSFPICLFKIGSLIGSSLVSIYSIGFIAIDRYIYILYGLYYERWINTSRVRISILITWIIGITIGFMPATGWVNSDLSLISCYYFDIYPSGLILLNMLLCILPIILVVILYCKILVTALKNVRTRSRKATKHGKEALNNSKINRGTKTDTTITNESVVIPKTTHFPNLARNSSFPDSNKPEKESAVQPASIDDKATITNMNDITVEWKSKPARDSIISDSTISVCTTETDITEHSNIPEHKNSKSNQLVKKVESIKKTVLKASVPNKWRAITIVLVTSGTFIFSHMPTVTTVSLYFFYFCEDNIMNDECMHMKYLITGPFATLSFTSCLINPLIYAWWHKGFRKFIKKYIKKA